jgi:nucleoside-diphosphate-sugar epimerase
MRMKVLVLGATSNVGRLLTSGAAERGHHVTALVRAPEELELPDETLRLVVGDVLDGGVVSDAVDGVNAVVVALADTPDRRGAAAVAAQGTLNAVRSMQRYGVRRLVVLSSSAVSPAGQLGHPGILTRLLDARSRNRYTADLRRMEVTVRQSRLDWTLVRAARLTDDPATGNCRAEPGYSLPGGRRIARADVADYMLDQLTLTGDVGHAVAVAG